MTVYATKQDVLDRAVASQALQGVTDAQIDGALADASDEADGYLRHEPAPGFVLPLTSWGSALRRYVAQLAAFHLIRRRGLDPEAKEYESIRALYKDAIAWLDKVSAGTVKLTVPEYQDSAPVESEERGPRGRFVVSARTDSSGNVIIGPPSLRGWR